MQKPDLKKQLICYQLVRSIGLRRIESVRQRLKVIGILDQVP